MEPIKVFGSNAEEIIEGQTFVATVGSVEGRKVVTLHPVSLDEIEISEDDFKELKHLGHKQRGARKY